MPTEHSNVMGGSTAAQRINCPGSYQAEQNAPPKKVSEYADEGSMLHAAMELIIINDPASVKDAQPVFDDLIGQNLGFEGHEITEEHVNEKLIPATQAWLDVLKQYDIDDWFIEQRVSLEKVVPGAFGTADILAKDTKGRLHVLDWKFGDGVPVPVEANYGAGFYAAAAMYDEDPEIEEFCADITGVVLHIVQPRRGIQADPLDSWETSVDWVEKLIDQAAEAADKAQQDDPPLKAGSWCRWCAAKASCPEQQCMATEAVSKQPDAMTAVELADALELATQVEAWAKSVFELAQNEAEAGAAVPGWKLVQKRATRKFSNEAEVATILRRSKCKVDDIYNKKLKSPAQIEKKFPKLYSRKLADLVESRSSGVTLVRDSDKRPAVVSSMSLLANALPEQKH